MFRNCLVKVNACFQLGHMEQQLEKLLDTVMSSCRYVVFHIIGYGNKLWLIIASHPPPPNPPPFSFFVCFSTAVAVDCKLLKKENVWSQGL
jgi:hypothetical protein